MIKTLISSALVLILFCSPVLARWTEPVPLNEVNTESTGEGWAFLSFDGLTLYFARWGIESQYPLSGGGGISINHFQQMYQAKRSNRFGIFTSVTQIDELAFIGGHVHSAWVSPDNLRMYFLRTEPGSVWRIKESTRQTESSPWESPRNLTELNNLGDVGNPKLSCDELSIVFNVYKDESIGSLYTANRSDCNAVFTNIREVIELNSSDVRAQYLTPEGLTLYFARNDNGVFHNYKSTRPSTNSYFGKPELLNNWSENFSPCCFSLDGEIAYLYKDSDIYVSFYLK